MRETKRRVWELVREVTSATVTLIVKYTVLKVTRQYPLVLLAEVLWGRVLSVVKSRPHAGPRHRRKDNIKVQ